MSYGTTGAEDAWCDFVKARVGDEVPLRARVGQPREERQNGNINDFSACLPNQLPGVVGTYGRQYYVDVPQVNPLVRFVMISPNLVFPDGGRTNYPAGSARYNWTATAIDGARSANIPWVVVGMHKPCLSMGEYACDPGADLMNMLISQEGRPRPVRPRAPLPAHRSSWRWARGARRSRSAPTTRAASWTPTTRPEKGAGTVLATIGTGGLALRDVNLSDPEAGYFAASSGPTATRRTASPTSMSRPTS